MAAQPTPPQSPNPISPDEAWTRLLPRLAPLPPELLARRAARGRVLAAPLAATVDVPAADVSAMDGYAFAAPLTDGDVRPVAGRIAAGDPPGAVLPPGAALKIMTGAPLPAGADRVVPFELTDPGDATVTVHRATAEGTHVRRRGEVVRAGEELLPAGVTLGPAALSVAAAHGHAELPVHRAPRVAVLTTGDEVVPPEETPGPGCLRDSHTDLLLAAGTELGLAFTPLGIAPDDPAELAARIAHGLAGHDVLLLGGGVSAGELDFVEAVLGDLAFRPLVTSVAIQPGKPLVVAARGEDDDPGRRLVFGLPGNPASVLVTFLLFARPALLRLMGHRADPFDPALDGVLASPSPGARDRHRFLPATLAPAGRAGGAPQLSPVPLEGSHDLRAYARADALLWIPPGSAPGLAGTPCRYLPLRSV